MTSATASLSNSVAPGTGPLLRVENLSKFFPIRGGLLSRVRQHVRAVDGVSFELPANRTLGLVGESGCGKTTVGRTLLGLIKPTGGQVWFRGESLFDLPRHKLRQRRRSMQIIFQDPYGSLNPRMTVGTAVAEPLKIHGLGGDTPGGVRARVLELLARVGLPPTAIDRYPHEFSGGQRQRVGIARALALNPSFIVCDEPTSALDVSIRAQVINLLGELQREHAMSYLFISHDLGAVRYISHEVAVMYLGKIVEQAPTEQLFQSPRHPYTRVLLSAIPVPDPNRKQQRVVATDDDIPSPINIPSGCAFHPRCPLFALKGSPAICREQTPLLQLVGPTEGSVAASVAGGASTSPQSGGVIQPKGGTHLAACHFAEESALLT